MQLYKALGMSPMPPVTRMDESIISDKIHLLLSNSKDSICPTMTPCKHASWFCDFSTLH